jgi:hypothetical protein
MQILFIFAAIVLLVLAGLNIAGRYFNPAYFGWACVVVALFWTPLTAIGD